MLSVAIAQDDNKHETSAVLRALKKRPVRSTRDMVNLSSYNSDFLSGLFADVAKANVLSQFEIGEKRGAEVIEPSDEESEPTPTKKSRLSLNRCLSRARASQINLSELSDNFPSPKGVRDFPGAIESSIPKHDSLAFQLSCVSDSSDSVGEAARLAFPNLPATVSDSSCSTGLTRSSLVRQAPSTETENKESFGWFVDLDDNQTPAPSVGMTNIVSSENLAFQAQTAPKGAQDNAELEWAQAADTVDDVLGDFF
jgi:hypothetical protein